MIQQLDTPTESRWFASIMRLDEPSPRDGSISRSRRDDTSVEVLAYEIALYMPELARSLAARGQRKLLAA